MRIGHCQMEVTTNDFDANLGRVVKGLEQAQRERVEIVCFPECCLTGYPDKEDIVRKGAFAANGPQVMQVLDKTSKFDPTFIVGFNETRGKDLYNTAIVIHKGHILGTYSKCTAYMPFHKQGREFPVFERNGTKFGVVICSDGGFIEPARILSLKGAQMIFSPHFNAINARGVIGHFAKVRCDHIARAVENHVYFVRGNNVYLGNGLDDGGRVGYGDSYIVDPHGEIVVRSRRHQEDFIFCDVDLKPKDTTWKVGRSMFSLREFHKHLLELLPKEEKKP